eukprot:scaffold268237_cov28-Tisochrysis_lutea.AAC.5
MPGMPSQSSMKKVLRAPNLSHSGPASTRMTIVPPTAAEPESAISVAVRPIPPSSVARRIYGMSAAGAKTEKNVQKKAKEETQKAYMCGCGVLGTMPRNRTGKSTTSVSPVELTPRASSDLTRDVISASSVSILSSTEGIARAARAASSGACWAGLRWSRQRVDGFGRARKRGLGYGRLQTANFHDGAADGLSPVGQDKGVCGGESKRGQDGTRGGGREEGQIGSREVESERARRRARARGRKMARWGGGGRGRE